MTEAIRDYIKGIGEGEERKYLKVCEDKFDVSLKRYYPIHEEVMVSYYLAGNVDYTGTDEDETIAMIAITHIEFIDTGMLPPIATEEEKAEMDEDDEIYTIEMCQDMIWNHILENLDIETGEYEQVQSTGIYRTPLKTPIVLVRNGDDVSIVEKKETDEG